MIGQKKKSYLDPRNIFGQSSLQKLTQKINTIFEENEHESHREEKQILKDNDEQQSKNQTDQKSELESKDKQGDQQETQITGEKPQTKCKDWMQIQWRRFKFYPNSPFKIKWDLFVILLSIYNSILVPFNFAFPNVLGVIPILQVFEYLIDVCFAFDIVVNFRSVYMNQQTEQYVTDGKAIALNYILKGRFVIDLFASLPVEEIFDLFNISAQVSKSNLKLISLFKLVRLLRLGRIITFLKMNQNFKQSLKIVQLFFMLIMVLHWIACLWYYVTNLEQTWMPQKDSLKSIDQIYMYTKDDYGDQYIDDFYYGLLALVGNEMMPSNAMEIGVVSIIIFTGSIIIGTIIGEFSSILGELSLKEREINEELDMINLMMTSLKIPENTQNRVLQYYDLKNSMRFVKNEQFYDLLNENLTKLVKLFQTEDAIMKINLFDKHNTNQIENFANLMKVSIYLPSDVVAKQGDIGDYFYVVIDGLAEVRSETKDFMFFDHDSTLKFLGDSRPKKRKEQSIFQKFKEYLSKKLRRPQKAEFVKNNKKNLKQRFLEKLKQKIKMNVQKLQKKSFQQKLNILDLTQQDLLVHGQSASIYSDKLSQLTDQTQFFKVINELKQGDYFGEISIITNLKKTCSVYSVNNLICGLIKKKDLLELVSTNTDFKSRMMQRMNLYKDNFFKFIITMIRNVGAFRVIPNHAVKNIIYKLNERKFIKHSLILRMGEISENAYFILRGKVGVYVFVGDFNDYENSGDFNQQNYEKLCILDEGSNFNITHFILQKESIFLFRAEEDTDLLLLTQNDYQKLSQRSEILQNINDSMEALYGDEGNKYDFGRMIYKSISDIIKAQKVKENYMKTKQQKIEELKSQGEEHVNIYEFKLLQEINRLNNLSDEEDGRSAFKQYVRLKFKRNLMLLRLKGFHASQMEIFSCIDQINYRRVRKECERKMDRGVQTLSENFFQLQVIQNISEYTMLSSYYSKYPQIKEMNEFYVKLKREERVNQKKKIEELNSNKIDYPFNFKGPLFDPNELIQTDDEISQSINFENLNLNMGLAGPLIGVGQKNNHLIHSIDGLNEILDQNRIKMQQDLQNKEKQKEFSYKISVTNDGKLEEFQQQFKIFEYSYGMNYDEFGNETTSKLLKDEKHSLMLMNQLTEQAENNQDIIDMLKDQILESEQHYFQKLQDIESNMFKQDFQIDDDKQE
eukprot:403352016